jgi:hypothetical protein
MSPPGSQPQSPSEQVLLWVSTPRSVLPNQHLFTSRLTETRIMTQITSQPIGFSFINVAHPRDATSPSSLSQIRSHAAKDIRARRSAASRSNKKPKSTVRRRDQAAGSVADGFEKDIELKCTLEQGLVQERTPFHDHSVLLPDVLEVPRFSMRDPHWNLARTLSATEEFLLDHCMSLLARSGLSCLLEKHLTHALARCWLRHPISQWKLSEEGRLPTWWQGFRQCQHYLHQNAASVLAAVCPGRPWSSRGATPSLLPQPRITNSVQRLYRHVYCL